MCANQFAVIFITYYVVDIYNPSMKIAAKSQNVIFVNFSSFFRQVNWGSGLYYFQPICNLSYVVIVQRMIKNLLIIS